MRFNLFSSRGAPEQGESAAFNTIQLQQERERLNNALYSTLETLPESFSGRENIRLLCDRVAAASSHLRFVWVGFSDGAKEMVRPHAFAGTCAAEVSDWSIPAACFMSPGTYLRDVPARAAGVAGSDPFSPWVGQPLCSAVSALALNLRSEKPGLRGMLVFYADSPDYFAQIGSAVFQSFCHLAEIIWKQSNLVHIATQVAQQDPLTNLMGRRQTMVVLEKEIATAETMERPLSVLICKIDGLSKLNEMHGLQAADSILAAFAREAGTQMRAQDMGGRWTGTEFLYVLPGTSAEQAAALASKLEAHFRVTSINVRHWSIRLALRTGIATHSRNSLGLADLIMLAHQNIDASQRRMSDVRPVRGVDAKTEAGPP